MADTKYLVKHKDIPVCEIAFDSDTGAIIHVDNIDPSHAPINAKDSKSFASWWERRAIPKQQVGKEVLLDDSTRMEYLIKNLGLSLNDHYWICPSDKDYHWRDVNLYENNFSEIDFAVESFQDTIPFKPSSSTQGDLPKRWIIQNGERYLVKGNFGVVCRQSVNEVFATRLHEMQQRPHTKYSLVKLPESMGQGIGCISKNFTNIDIEFIPCYDITFMAPQPKDISIYEHYIQICIAQGLPEETVRDYMDYQILTDFLLTNTDRHLLNLGILRDSETLEWKSLAPIFDSGNSMFFDRNYSEASVCDIKINSFAKTELRMLEYVKNRKAVDLSRIPGTELIDELYKHDPYSLVYLDNLKRGYDKKVEMLGAFQQGYSLNPRSSRFYRSNTPRDMNERG